MGCFPSGACLHHQAPTKGESGRERHVLGASHISRSHRMALAHAHAPHAPALGYSFKGLSLQLSLSLALLLTLQLGLSLSCSRSGSSSPSRFRSGSRSGFHSDSVLFLDTQPVHPILYSRARARTRTSSLHPLTHTPLPSPPHTRRT